MTITAQNYGAFGQVAETLPAGFRFVQSSLPASAVNAETDTVKFTLLGDESFTYTVEAPAAEGTYSFSGLLLDQAKVENQVGGDTSLRVGPAPTPAPHRPQRPNRRPQQPPRPRLGQPPRPRLGQPPRPRLGQPPRPRLEPTATPTPRPMATPTPEPAVAPTAAPAPEPTATPVPQPTATPTRVPLVSPPRTDEGGGVPGWVILLGVLIIAAGIIAWIGWWRSGRFRQ